MKNLVFVTWLVALVTLYPQGEAQAYLDPGTGSYAVQVAIGLLFGATYAFRSFGGRLMLGMKQLFRKQGSKPQEPAINDEA